MDIKGAHLGEPQLIFNGPGVYEYDIISQANEATRSPDYLSRTGVIKMWFIVSSRALMDLYNIISISLALGMF